MALLAAFAAFAACVPGSNSDSPTSPADRRSEPAPIDELEILTRESFPPGYTARIVSGLPSGCAQFESAEITGRSGNTITIAVTNTMPADPNVACTAIYGYKETNLDLGKDFTSGETYTVKGTTRRPVRCSVSYGLTGLRSTLS